MTNEENHENGHGAETGSSSSGQPEIPGWLLEVRKNLPVLQTTANLCDESFKVKCFEILLIHSLQVSTGTMHPPGVIVATREQTTAETGHHVRYNNFLRQRNLDHASMKRLLDFDSGDILVAGLGMKKADVQRKLASIVAVWNLSKTGELVVPRDELKRVCERAGVYDAGNFSSYMKNARYRNSVVFVEDQSGWKVTTPGEGFVSDVVNELLHSLG